MYIKFAKRIDGENIYYQYDDIKVTEYPKKKMSRPFEQIEPMRFTFECVIDDWIRENIIYYTFADDEYVYPFRVQICRNDDSILQTNMFITNKSGSIIFDEYGSGTITITCYGTSVLLDEIDLEIEDLITNAPIFYYDIEYALEGAIDFNANLHFDYTPLSIVRTRDLEIDVGITAEGSIVLESENRNIFWQRDLIDNPIPPEELNVFDYSVYRGFYNSNVEGRGLIYYGRESYVSNYYIAGTTDSYLWIYIYNVIVYEIFPNGAIIKLYESENYGRKINAGWSYCYEQVQSFRNNTIGSVGEVIPNGHPWWDTIQLYDFINNQDWITLTIRNAISGSSGVLLEYQYGEDTYEYNIFHPCEYIGGYVGIATHNPKFEGYCSPIIMFSVDDSNLRFGDNNKSPIVWGNNVYNKKFNVKQAFQDSRFVLGLSVWDIDYGLAIKDIQSTIYSTIQIAENKNSAKMEVIIDKSDYSVSVYGTGTDDINVANNDYYNDNYIYRYRVTASILKDYTLDINDRISFTNKFNNMSFIIYELEERDDIYIIKGYA